VLNISQDKVVWLPGNTIVHFVEVLCVSALQDKYPDLTIEQAVYWSVVTATTIGWLDKADTP
jgi:hypothetical protein